MSEEMKQETAQESQETTTNNNQESGSEPNYKQEMMKYKTQRNEEREINASYKAKEEERRTKKLEEDGKLKELLAEFKSENESLKPIRDRYKQTLVNGLTSDDERKEYLSTKSVDFLEELTKEKAAMAPPPVDNPQESLGSVRKVVSNKPYASMNEAERQEWHESQTAHLRK